MKNFLIDNRLTQTCERVHTIAEQIVNENAKRPDVYFLIVCSTLNQFRRHIKSRSHHFVPCLAYLLLHGKSEPAELHPWTLLGVQ